MGAFAGQLLDYMTMREWREADERDERVVQDRYYAEMAREAKREDGKVIDGEFTEVETPLLPAPDAA